MKQEYIPKPLATTADGKQVYRLIEFIDAYMESNSISFAAAAEILEHNYTYGLLDTEQVIIIKESELMKL